VTAFVPVDSFFLRVYHLKITIIVMTCPVSRMDINGERANKNKGRVRGGIMSNETDSFPDSRLRVLIQKSLRTI